MFDQSFRDRSRDAVMATLELRRQRGQCRPRRFTEEQVLEMMARKARGYSWADVGSHFGISGHAAKQQVERWGVDPRSAQLVFDDLDATSRQRALNEVESRRLETAMRMLGMI